MREYYDYYDVTKVENNVFRLTSQEGTAIYLFCGEKKALLLDTAYGFGDLRGAVRKLTDLPLVIVNSHGHVDHVGGNIQFAESAWLNPADWELAESGNTLEMRMEQLERAGKYMNYVTGKCGNILPKHFPRDHYLNADKCEFQFMMQGQVFDLGGITLEVYDLPGHTKGSIGLYYKEKKWLFCGDAFGMSPWLFAPESAKLSDFVGAIKRAIALAPHKIFGGHGTVEEPKDELDRLHKCALSLEYDKGIDFHSPLGNSTNARFCSQEASSMQEAFEKGCVAIVISKENADLNE